MARFILLSILLTSGLWAGEITLFDSEKTIPTVVLPVKADQTIKDAAANLIEYFKKGTGTELKIGINFDDYPVICLGTTRACGRV